MLLDRLSWRVACPNLDSLSLALEPKCLSQGAESMCGDYLDVVGTQDDPTAEHEASVNGQDTHHEAQHVWEGCLQGQDQNL